VTADTVTADMATADTATADMVTANELAKGKALLAPKSKNLRDIGRLQSTVPS